MLELTVLLSMVILSIIVLWYLQIDNTYTPIEEFSNYLEACPSGFTSFYNSNGDVVCCNGQTIANRCMGTKQCILNGNGTPDMPNCVEFMKDDYAKKSQEVCPSSMPTYYENTAKKLKGCTKGPLNQNMTGPKSTNQPKCIIYSDWNTNLKSSDSCYNYKNMDSIPCFGKGCSKQLVKPNPNGPPLVAIEFSDDMEIPRVAYTRESLTNYLNALYPNWKEQGIDLSRNISVAEVAKAVYVDKTMSPANLQF